MAQSELYKYGSPATPYDHSFVKWRQNFRLCNTMCVSSNITDQRLVGQQMNWKGLGRKSWWSSSG